MLTGAFKGFAFPKSKGFRVQGMKGFQGTEGLPMLTGAFKGLAFPKSIGFRVQGMKGFQDPKAQKLKR